MFACLYFDKDASLSVVDEKDPDLTILTKFQERCAVEMCWRLAPGKPKETLRGIIVKVGDNEDSLTLFATRAYNALLKELVPGSSVPVELFTFSYQEKKETKRDRVPTKRLEESREQQQELGSLKKRKSLSEKDNLPVKLQRKGLKKKAGKTDMPVDHATDDEKETQEDSACQLSETDKTVKTQNKRCKQKSGKSVTPVNQAAHQKRTQEDSALQIAKNMTSLFQQFQGPTNKQKPASVQPLPGSSVTPDNTNNSELSLTDTWEACHGALSVVDNQQSPTSRNIGQSESANHSALPPVSPSVLATLKGICSPEFVGFVKQLTEHMECSTCPHTCMKAVMDSNVLSLTSCSEGEQVRNTPINSSFLELLECSPRTSNNMLKDQMDGIPSLPQRTVGHSDVNAPSKAIDDIGTLQQTPRRSPGKRLDLISSNSFQCTALYQDQGDAIPAVSQKSVTHSVSNSPSQNLQRVGTLGQMDVPSLPRSTGEHQNENTPSKAIQDNDTLQTPRRSPRKRLLEMSPCSSTIDSDKVKLLPINDLSVSRLGLRKACQTAMKKKEKAAFHLMYSLLGQVFTVEELAQSRGTGIGRPRPGDEGKPVLNQEKLAVLKEYVQAWCKKNMGCTFPDKYLNDAVTERNAYARKQIKRL